MDESKTAPGQPGQKSHWLSGAKSGIGKALNAASNITFTISHGIINEVYFPREDMVCINELGFVVTDGKNFFAEERNDTLHDTRMYADGVPAYSITNKCKDGRFIIKKEIVADPLRNALLQWVRFSPIGATVFDYRLFMFLSPHIKNNGDGNNGWLGNYKGVPMIFAERDGVAIALTSSIPWKKRSVGYKGVSDGYGELLQTRGLVHEYQEAYRGNIMLTAEIDLNSCSSNELVIVVGFGNTETEAAHHALASLMDGFENAKKKYITEWQDWQESLHELSSANKSIGKNWRTSAMVLKVSEAKSHLVWPRDLVESSWGLLAMNAKSDALEVVNYLMSTQEAKGCWPQNMWLDGKAYWNGLQMDQVSLPLLIMNTCYQQDLLDEARLMRYWENIRLATRFILVNGPFTQQDRWEIQSGLALFTIATEISALLAAAEFADLFDERDMAEFCRDTADWWNENIETWTYVTDTDLARRYEIDGYYIRINPTDGPIDDNKSASIKIPGDPNSYPASEIISVDALALVRFGLRKPNDPRILNTIKVIDRELKVETSKGDCWRRFTHDTYGENDAGDPYNKTGRGRAWPLLTGERAHYEVAAGNLKQARKLLNAMDAFSYHGMLPEQIWDADDIPGKDLYRGRFTGSAMPLTWAHAEYIKLCRSIRQRKIFDMPANTHTRYIENETKCNFSAWRFTMQLNKISRHKKFLRIEVMSLATVRWTADSWSTENETETRDTQLGVFVADILLDGLNSKKIIFTFFWKDSDKWENKNFSVEIID